MKRRLLIYEEYTFKNGESNHTFVSNNDNVLYLCESFWCDTSSNVFFVKKSIAVLKTMGIKKRTIITFVCLFGTNYDIVICINNSNHICKKIVYDLLITNFYLTWNLCGTVFVIVMLLSIGIAFLTGIILCNKIKKEAVYKILREE